MVGIALGLAAYTPLRHFSSAADVALGPDARDLTDTLAPDGGTTLKKGAAFRETGPLAWAARLHRDPQVIPNVGVPDPTGHFARGLKPLFAPKEMPAPTVA